MAQATRTASSADNEVSRGPMPIIDLEWETELGWEGGDQLEQWDGGLEFCADLFSPQFLPFVRYFSLNFFSFIMLYALFIMLFALSLPLCHSHRGRAATLHQTAAIFGPSEPKRPARRHHGCERLRALVAKAIAAAAAANDGS